MAESNLKAQILKLGRADATEELTQLILNQDNDELAEAVVEGLDVDNGPAALFYTLKALDLNPDFESMRFKVILATLKELKKDNCIQEKTSKTIIQELAPGVQALSSENLANLVDFLIRSVESLGNRSGQADLSWIQILKTVLTEVEEKASILPKDHHIATTGKEFRAEILDSLCATPWNCRTSIALCLVFQQLKMTGMEVELVFKKLDHQLSNAAVGDIGPLFHQILKLLSHHSSCSAQLFISIAQYFKSLRKNNINCVTGGGQAEEQELLNSTGGGRRDAAAAVSPAKINQAEVIVVYHLIQAANLGHPVAASIAKLAKSWTAYPAALLNQFTLFTCLSLTSLQKFNESMCDTLRMAISKGIALDECREQSVWFRTNTPKLVNLQDLFSEVISASLKQGGWDLIGEGLIELAMLLLDAKPPLGKTTSPRTQAMHSLGGFLLCKVVSSHSISGKRIIGRLNERLIVNQQPQQYVAALRMIAKDATTFLLEHSNTAAITDLVHSLSSLSSHITGRSVLDALVPVLKIDRSLRNPVILSLRKSMFCRSIESREIGVSGIYSLLKTFKISTNINSSQLSQSSGSFSQMASDIMSNNKSSAAGPNDLFCAELMGVLCRCYSLQPEVKVVMYEGMYDVVAKNPELCEGFLDLLNTHVVKLFGVWSADNDPFDLETFFSKALVCKEGRWSIGDPLGWFLHTLQALVNFGQQFMEEGTSAVLDDQCALLEKLVQYFSNAEIHELWIDFQDNLDRRTEEGKKRCLEVELLLTVYEALMDFVVGQGADNNSAKADLLLKLLTKHQGLERLLATAIKSKKPPAKKGKKTANGTAAKDPAVDDDGETVGDGDAAGQAKDKQLDETGRGGGGGGRGEKRPREQNDFAMKKHAFSLRSLSSLLRSVLENRSPERQAALGKLRQSDTLLAYLQTLAAALLDRCKGILAMTGDEGLASSNNLFKHMKSIAATLFRHSVTNQEPVEDFLQPGTQLTCQYLRALFAHFPDRKLELIACLAGSAVDPLVSGPADLNPVIVACLGRCADRLTELNDELEAATDDDTVSRRLGSVVDIYGLLLRQLNEASPVTGPLEWLKRFTERFTSASDTDTDRPVVQLIFLANLRLTTSQSLCPRVAQQLHAIYGDLDDSRVVESSKNFGFLSDDSAEMVFRLLVEHLEDKVEFADNAITWLKASLGSGHSQDDITRTELAITEQMVMTVNPSLELVNTSLPVGTHVDILLKFLIKVFKVLGNLATYFFLRSRFAKTSVKASRFDKLVGIVGQRLSPNIYSLITYSSNKFKEQEEAHRVARQQKNKSVDPNLARSKILKATRYIPTLIFHIETFEKNMAKVGKRINENFKFKTSTSRDFRIKLTAAQQEEFAPQSEGETDEDEEEGEGEEDRDEEGE